MVDSVDAVCCISFPIKYFIEFRRQDMKPVSHALLMFSFYNIFINEFSFFIGGGGGGFRGRGGKIPEIFSI